jgi:lactoylglutathione lyase
VDTPLGTVSVITLFIAELERSKAFYRSAFELPMVFSDANSAVFRFDNMMINLLLIAHAPELVEPLAVTPHETGASFLITVPVADVDAACAQLADRGVALLNGPMDRPWGIRTAAFADPDGHVWEIAHDLP